MNFMVVRKKSFRTVIKLKLRDIGTKMKRKIFSANGPIFFICVINKNDFFKFKSIIR